MNKNQSKIRFGTFSPAFQYGMSIATEKTDRDRQTTIGASELSSPCDFCVAEKLSGESVNRKSPYWAAARTGTMIHGFYEANAPKDSLPEVTLDIGEIKGYGMVTGHADAYVKSSKMVWDLKTIDKADLSSIKLAFDKFSSTDSFNFRAKKFIGQISLYGIGVEKLGYDVERVGIFFHSRDAKLDKDFWGFDRDYDRTIAERLLERGQKIYDSLQNGKPVSAFLSKESCFPCGVINSDERKFSKTPY